MKSTSRLVIILISVVIVGVGIGLWRNHYLRIKNAEPVKIYKDAPEQQGTIPKDRTVKQIKVDKSTPEQPDISPEDTSVQSNDTDIALEPRETAQPTDESATPEATDNIGELTVHPVFTDIVVQNLPPKAATALKLYDESRLATAALTTELTPLLKEKPVDWDAVNPITEKLRQQNQRRFDALEILALYSDKASKQLEATIARTKETASRFAEMDKEMEGLKKTIEDIDKELEKISK